MSSNPLTIRYDLDGWQLLWAIVETANAEDVETAAVRKDVAAAVRRRFPDTASIASDATVAAMRKLFRAAGCDPTRYRPASEALIRRLVKGGELPAIQPIVDLNNCLSVEVAVPCCVMAESTFGTELVLRAGLPGESYQSLRGPFNLEKKPVLADLDGAVDTPITGNEKVKVHSDTARAWLVAYLPSEQVALAKAGEALRNLAGRCGLGVELLAD